MSDKNIVLMGIKHCGKSTLGKMLAEEMKVQFHDIDKIIENNFHEKTLTVREIHDIVKKEGFHKLETEAICRNIGDDEISVISLGGGTIDNEDAFECIAGTSIFVYLKEEPVALFKRIQDGGLPSFLKHTDPFSIFMKLYENRTVLYEKKADLIVEINGLDIKKAYEKLKEKLKEAGYVR